MTDSKELPVTNGRDIVEVDLEISADDVYDWINAQVEAGAFSRNTAAKITTGDIQAAAFSFVLSDNAHRFLRDVAWPWVASVATYFAGRRDLGAEWDAEQQRGEMKDRAVAAEDYQPEPDGWPGDTIKDKAGVDHPADWGADGPQ